MDKKKKERLRHGLRLLLVLTLCLIWGNSLLPGKESGELSNWFFAWLVRMGVPVPDEHFLRKAAHFCEFALLGAELTGLLWLRNEFSLQNAGNSAFAALLAAITDESIQLFTPGRGSQLTDVLLDFAGALTGIACTALLLTFLEKRTEKADPPG